MRANETSIVLLLACIFIFRKCNGNISTSSTLMIKLTDTQLVVIQALKELIQHQEESIDKAKL